MEKVESQTYPLPKSLPTSCRGTFQMGCSTEIGLPIIRRVCAKAQAGSTGSAAEEQLLWAENRRETRGAPPCWRECGGNEGAICRCGETRLFANDRAGMGEAAANFDVMVCCCFSC